MTVAGNGSWAGGPRPQRTSLSGLFSGRVMKVLAFVFNFLTLNLALVLGLALIVTAPMALNAAMVALDRWRGDGEDRVVNQFVSAFRSRSALRTTIAAGAPLAVAAGAIEEVHYFAQGGDLVNWLCLGSGVAALLVSVCSTGYVLVLMSRYPSAPVPDLWSLCIRLGLQNLLVTGLLFIIEFAGAVLVGLADPALVLIGLPLCFLFVMRRTAQFGLRRAGLPTSAGG